MKTGATEAQIEDAKRRANNRTAVSMAIYAGYLVPEDERIVALHDLKRLRTWIPNKDEDPDVVRRVKMRIDSLIAGDAS